MAVETENPSYKEEEDFEDTVEQHIGPDQNLPRTIVELHGTDPYLNLSGRVAAVTGVDERGIGRSTAELLAIHGASVIIQGKSKAGLEETAKFLEHASGSKAEMVIGDIGDPETALKFGSLIKKRGVGD